MTERTLFVRFMLLAVLTLAFPAWADEDFSERNRQLAEVRERIEAIEKRLNAEQSAKDQLGNELRRLERRIGDIALRLHEIDESITAKQSRIARLREDHRRLDATVDTHKRFLADQVVAMYAAGRQQYIKLLLNQEDPSRFDRMTVYYDYLSNARRERIEEAVAQIERLKQLSEELDSEVAHLARLRADQVEQRRELAEARESREQALAGLERQLEETGAQLARLQSDEKQLAELVRELQDTLADIREGQVRTERFADSQGRLPWPVDGKLAAAYGSERGMGLRWRGLLIGATSGTPVKAVSYGQVVFADWLRGFGLLIIVDHGDGYMTLYGHNEALYKEIGDWVRAGEVIGTVGNTGGRQKNGLYFEVRAKGEPVNPMRWLRRAG